MAAREPSNRTSKKRLENCDMQISHVCCEVERAYNLATLTISGLSNLKKDVVYMKPEPRLDAEFRLTKTKSSLTIMITCEYDLGKVSGSVLYHGIKTSKPVFAQKLDKWDSVIEIPYNAVDHAQNIFVKSGHVIIHLKCAESKKKTLKRMHACSKREISDAKKLCEDLKSVYRCRHDTDFIFKVDEKIIRVPKGILAARSEFLKKHPDIQNEIPLNTYYEAVSSAIDYLYTSEVPNFEKLKDQEILRVMEVGQTLKINSLVSKCLSHSNKLIIEGASETNSAVTDNCIQS